MNARIAGAREAILDDGLALPRDFVSIGEPDDPGLVSGLASGRLLDAVPCASDHVAAMLLRPAEKAGVRVPRDLRIVGFDDAKYATLPSGVMASYTPMLLLGMRQPSVKQRGGAGSASPIR